MDSYFLNSEDMYILISEKDITNAEVLARYHERLPDGRLIITPQELKTLGSIPECQIVATKAEVMGIIARQEEEGVTPPDPAEETGEGTDAPEGTDAEMQGDAEWNTDGEDADGAEQPDPAEEPQGTDGGNYEENNDSGNDETEITEEQDYGNDAGSGEL